jgi:hypothetical protein
VSSKEVMRLSLDWGLIVVLMRCVVDGYTQLSQCALLNASFRKKFSSLSPAVAIHPDAAHATMYHDELYRLPLLCLRALRSFTKYYFPVTVRQNDNKISTTLENHIDFLPCPPILSTTCSSVGKVPIVWKSLAS